MKNISLQILKMSSILILLFNNTYSLQAQELQPKKDSRIYTSMDITYNGIQGRIAYDFYTVKGTCLGFSISQLGGIKQEYGDNTMYYNMEEIRLNMSFRYTKYLFEFKRLSTFGTIQAGVSYNTLLTGDQLILPSFRAGGGINFRIYKESGIRIEAGIGSPYFGSIGYFFKI